MEIQSWFCNELRKHKAIPHKERLGTLHGIATTWEWRRKMKKTYMTWLAAFLAAGVFLTGC
ncbi:MAG: hypothetical protein ACLT29_08660, partial [Ruminococcus callidus]